MMKYLNKNIRKFDLVMVYDYDHGLISKKVANFSDKYIKMLESGGTKHHKELLSPFGLDASKTDFWQSGLDVIINYINQIEE